MTEWIITSSVLILVVIALRTVLKGKISLRLQYALWALVLVRLLIPGSLFGSSFSVMNAVEKPAAPAEITIADPPSRRDPIFQMAPSITWWVDEEGNTQNDLDWDQWEQDMDAAWEEYKEEHTQYITLPVAGILRIVWYVGMAAMALWLIIGNLRFYLRLTRSREIMKFAPPAIYTVEGIETPCLFGLFHPSVYVTPEVAEDKTALAHVLAHEETHYRHKDHIWALLRCVCLVLHWYNPLVWLAAALSRRDSELACDEGAICRLGEEQRVAYGRTLIGLTCTGVGGLLRTATTMTGSKKSIKERIVLIARKPKMKLYTLIAVILIAVIAAGCTFTGQSMDFPAWVATITVEDLDNQSTGDEDSEAFLFTPGEASSHSMREDARQELLTILQGIKRSDFTSRDPGLTEYGYSLSITGTVHGGLQSDSWWQFTCLSDGMLEVTCLQAEIAARYGFRDVQYLDCPELYSFIITQTDSYEEDEPQHTEGEPFDWEEQLEDIVRQMMAEHAVELTAQLGRQVSSGAVQNIERTKTVAVGMDTAVEIYKVDYVLLHDLQGDSEEPVYGGVVSYTRYLFLMDQDGDPILLGNMEDVYVTPEMIDQYGDAYTAAAGELYRDYMNHQMIPPEGEGEFERAYQMVVAFTPNAAEAALFDLNGDGVDEIIVKAGTCEADFEYIVYALNGATGTVESIGRENGGNSYLAVSEDGALVIAGGQMGVEWAYRVTWDGSSFVSEQLFMRPAENGGYTQWPKRVQTVIVSGGVMEAPQPGEPVGKSGVGLTVEGESAKAAAEGFFMAYSKAVLRSNGAVADYKVQYNETLEISTDGNAVVGRFGCTVLLHENAEIHPDSGWKQRTGDYEGWYIATPYFLLEKQADGLWLCTQWSTDDKGLQLSDFGYKNGLWGAIYGNPKAYRCRETDPQKAAETLVFAYVDDLTKMDNMRCFTITDYRNLEVSVTPTLEMSEADRSVYNYNLKDSEIGEDHWIVEFTMEYRWIGILHDPPAGPGNGEHWMEQVHQGSPVGFLLTRDGDKFILRSRYPDRY